MKRKLVTLEQILWIVILALAVAVRFVNLGAEPLSDVEAGWALQALSLFPGASHIESVAPGPQAGYISITGLLLWVLGSSDAAARFLPAFAGSLLCLVPFFFRSWLGRRAALVMGFGLALDPGLVTISRLAGGPMPALSFLFLALGLLAAGYVLISGIALGLALLSGPSIWLGLLIVAVSGILVKAAGKAGMFARVADADNSGQRIFPPLATWKVGLVSVGLTVLVVGTLFGYFTQGLGAVGASLPAYLSGWVAFSGISAVQMLAVLLVYLPLALIFAVIGGVRGWAAGDGFAQRMVVWVVAAMLLVLLYPGRQVGDLVWVLVPLWGLASLELARYLEVEPKHRAIVFGQAALVFIMLCLFWLNLAGFSQSITDQRSYWLRIAILLGVLFLAGLTTVLLGYGWTWKGALQGLVWGLVAGLVVYQVAGMWNSARPATAQVLNIWHPSPQAGENRLLMQTVDDFSKRNTGMADQIDVLVAVDSPSLRWSFRNFPNATFIPENQAAALGESPSMVITRVEQQDPALAASYRGQDLPWWRMPGWVGTVPQSMPAWIAYRQNPASLTPVILWARSDLFADASTAASEGEIAPAQLDAPLEEGVPQ